MKLKKLNPQEKSVIVHKGTEEPFSGIYENFYKEGVYVCRRCETPLYRSGNKFNAFCGWPSFDQEIPGNVKCSRDADGCRTEISCVACGAHLGHVFEGEGLTSRNIRHCVNSISMKFIPKAKNEK
jgi:methionine-R-sulfoxide reductase